jgi:hypothetical protein
MFVTCATVYAEVSITASKVRPAKRIDVAFAVAAELLEIREELRVVPTAVEERHVVSGGDRSLDDMPSEKNGTSENENPHEAISPEPRQARAAVWNTGVLLSIPCVLKMLPSGSGKFPTPWLRMHFQ